MLIQGRPIWIGKEKWLFKNTKFLRLAARGGSQTDASCPPMNQDTVRTSPHRLMQFTRISPHSQLAQQGSLHPLISSPPFHTLNLQMHHIELSTSSLREVPGPAPTWFSIQPLIHPASEIWSFVHRNDSTFQIVEIGTLYSPIDLVEVLVFETCRKALGVGSERVRGFLPFLGLFKARLTFLGFGNFPSAGRIAYTSTTMSSKAGKRILK